jgi:hypothetical protein
VQCHSAEAALRQRQQELEGIEQGMLAKQRADHKSMQDKMTKLEDKKTSNEQRARAESSRCCNNVSLPAAQPPQMRFYILFPSACRNELAHEKTRAELIAREAEIKEKLAILTAAEATARKREEDAEAIARKREEDCKAKEDEIAAHKQRLDDMRRKSLEEGERLRQKMLASMAERESSLSSKVEHERELQAAHRRLKEDQEQHRAARRVHDHEKMEWAQELKARGAPPRALAPAAAHNVKTGVGARAGDVLSAEAEEIKVAKLEYRQLLEKQLLLKKMQQGNKEQAAAQASRSLESERARLKAERESLHDENSRMEARLLKSQHAMLELQRRVQEKDEDIVRMRNVARRSEIRHGAPLAPGESGGAFAIRDGKPG